ncbi:hypothetical protein DIPPA_10068 [Diplonema papillatum]|nr:hypothetical protein DIPPA_10068 [Diplonema papillatum]
MAQRRVCVSRSVPNIVFERSEFEETVEAVSLKIKSEGGVRSRRTPADGVRNPPKSNGAPDASESEAKAAPGAGCGGNRPQAPSAGWDSGGARNPPKNCAPAADDFLDAFESAEVGPGVGCGRPRAPPAAPSASSGSEASGARSPPKGRAPAAEAGPGIGWAPPAAPPASTGSDAGGARKPPKNSAPAADDPPHALESAEAGPGTIRSGAGKQVAELPEGQAEAGEIFRDLITSVYALPDASDASTMTATIHADNPAETQHDVPVYPVLMITIAHADPAAFGSFEICAVPGTDIASGAPAACPFYSKTRNGVCYRSLLLFMLREVHAKDASRAVNAFLQTVEACFNCVGRHKEVFEYVVRAYADTVHRPEKVARGAALHEGEHDSTHGRLSIASDGCSRSVGSSPTSDSSLLNNRSLENAPFPVSPVKPCNAPLRAFFQQWLDGYKIQALYASIVNPLLFATADNYSVFENIESHGSSFWGSVIQSALGIPMPLQDIRALDSGWTWAARTVNTKLSNVKAAVAASMDALRRPGFGVLPNGPSGSNFRKICKDIPTCRSAESSVRMMRAVFRGGSLERLCEDLARQRLEEHACAEFAAPLQRFLDLLEPKLMLEHFALFFINNQHKMPGGLAALDPSLFIDACDPDRIVFEHGTLVSLLHQHGIPFCGSCFLRSPGDAPPPSPPHHCKECRLVAWPSPSSAESERPMLREAVGCLPIFRKLFASPPPLPPSPQVLYV